MSRLWISIVVVIALGAAAGMLLVKDPGYVLVSYGDVALETSVWMAALLLVAGYLVVRCLVMLIRGTRNGMKSVTGWGTKRRLGRAHQETGKGLLLWAEGDWRESERLLSASAGDSDFPLLNHLFAARSAHALGHSESRDRHLDLAVALEPGAEFAVSLMKSEFLLETGDVAEAARILQSLRSRAPRHPKVLLDLVECCTRSGDYALQLELLKTPGLTALLSETELNNRIQAAWSKRLSVEPVTTVWASVPKDLQKSRELVEAYVDRLVATQAPGPAEEVLRGALKQAWSPSLIVRYGQLITSDTAAQIQYAEQWLKKRGDDPDLLLALGRLYARNGEVEKAENALRACLRLRADKAAHAELGRILSAHGDVSRAADHLLLALQKD